MDFLLWNQVDIFKQQLFLNLPYLTGPFRLDWNGKGFGGVTGGSGF